MQLIFDHQAFSYQDYGGVSRYFTELISRLRDVDNVDCYLSQKYSNNAYLSAYSFAHRTFLKGFDFKGKRKLLLWLNKVETEKNLKKRSFDVFHPTYYDPYFLNSLGNRPFVLTIFDMIHERYPRYFAKHDQTSAFKKLLVSKANRIIAISESTKEDIVQILGVDPARIDVVYLAAAFVHIMPGYVAPALLSSRFFLYIGNRNGYKNFDILVRAISSISKDERDLHLVCCGGGSFSKPEIDLFRSKGLLQRVHYFAGTDENMYSLYRKAEAFIFPSLYEGFGIPVLEAFLCGCPVILSKSSSLPEVGGDAPLYFDPLDELSLVSALKEVFFKAAKRTDMIEKGTEQLKKFSWDKTATATLAVYKKVLSTAGAV